MGAGDYLGSRPQEAQAAEVGDFRAADPGAAEVEGSIRQAVAEACLLAAAGPGTRGAVGTATLIVS